MTPLWFGIMLSVFFVLIVAAVLVFNDIIIKLQARVNRLDRILSDHNERLEFHSDRIYHLRHQMECVEDSLGLEQLSDPNWKSIPSGTGFYLGTEALATNGPADFPVTETFSRGIVELGKDREKNE